MFLFWITYTPFGYELLSQEFAEDSLHSCKSVKPSFMFLDDNVQLYLG
jgi:hypothetical protein